MLESKPIILTILPLTLLISACNGGATAAPTSALTLATTTTAARLTATIAPTQTPAPRLSPTPATQPAVTIAPGRGQPVQWSDSKEGLVAGMASEPYPPELGATTTFKIILSDAEGRAVTDASVELTVTGGVAGMEGEHDETSNLSLASQGDGLYMIRTVAGRSDLALTGMSLSIRRGSKQWSFVISKDELLLR